MDARRESLVSARRLTNTLESITEGFLLLDRQWRVLYVNGAAERMARLARGAMVGRLMWECFPDEKESEFHRCYERALAEDLPQVHQGYWAPLSLWLEARAYPSEEGLAIYFRDITGQQAIAQELRAHRERLEQLVASRTRELAQINAELTGFTLAVAHDLRAPLAAITGFNRALADRLWQHADDKTIHYLERVQTAATRMEAMLQGLIELARVVQAPLERRPVNVSAVAADVMAVLRAGCEFRAAEVAIQPGMVADADPVLLRIVLEQLIGNAWKFTAGREPARIAVGQEEDGSFHVTDNGAGFEMDYAQNLFAPFQQLHPEGQFPAGAGIGLAAVRRVVQRHGGAVRADSRPGHGTTIWFTLPPHKAAG